FEGEPSTCRAPTSVAHTIRPHPSPTPFARLSPVAFRPSHFTRRPTSEEPMSKLLRIAMVAVVGLLANAVLAVAGDEKPKLEGQYIITAGERNGQAIPEADLKGATVRFTNNKVVAATKDGAEFLAADYTLDGSKKPCAIVLKLTAGSDKGKDM